MGLCITATGEPREGWGQQVKSGHEKEKTLHGDGFKASEKGKARCSE